MPGYADMLAAQGGNIFGGGGALPGGMPINPYGGTASLAGGFSGGPSMTPNAASQAYAQALPNMLLQQQRFSQQQQLMNSLMGGMRMGGGRGGKGMGDFQSVYDQASGKILESLQPGQDQARELMKRRLLAEGGENALGSGAGLAATSGLERELGAAQSGALGSLYSSLYSPWASATAQMANAQRQMQMQFMMSLLGSLRG